MREVNSLILEGVVSSPIEILLGAGPGGVPLFRFVLKTGTDDGPLETLIDLPALAEPRLSTGDVVRVIAKLAPAFELRPGVSARAIASHLEVKP